MEKSAAGDRYVGEMVCWAVLGVVPFFVGLGAESSAQLTVALRIVSLLAAALGLRIFWRMGGPRVTATGLWGLASAVFIGFAGYWWSIQPATQASVWTLFEVTAIGYWSTLGMAYFWRPLIATPPPLPAASSNATRWGLGYGAALSAAAVVAWALGVKIGSSVVQEASFAGMSLFATALTLRAGDRGGLRSARGLVIAGVVVYAFSVTTFTGYGRLILVSLGLVPLIVISRRATARHLKAALILALAPSLALFAKMRQVFAEQHYGVSDVSGIGSVVSPLSDFARLVDAHSAERFSYGHGDSFLATLTVLVPRAVWPGKPIGFGSVLTQILDPELVKANVSLAALAHGEWFYGFGWLGVILMVPAFGCTLRWLDGRFNDQCAKAVDSPRALLLLLVGLLFVCDIPNLEWVGSFGYLSRSLVRAGVVVALMAFAPTARRYDKARFSVKPGRVSGAARETHF